MDICYKNILSHKTKKSLILCIVCTVYLLQIVVLMELVIYHSSVLSIISQFRVDWKTSCTSLECYRHGFASLFTCISCNTKSTIMENDSN